MEFAVWGGGFLVVWLILRILLTILKNEDKMMIERKEKLFGKEL